MEWRRRKTSKMRKKRKTHNSSVCVWAYTRAHVLIRQPKCQQMGWSCRLQLGQQMDNSLHKLATQGPQMAARKSKDVAGGPNDSISVQR